MHKEEWGIKRICLGCGTKFYDFNKPVIVCPTCGEQFDPEYLSKRKAKIVQDKEVVDDITDVDLIEDESDDIDEEVPLNETEN